MAVKSPASARLKPLVDAVSRALGRHGVKVGPNEGAKAAMRVELEANVRRVVQVYWTPFQAEIPGESIGLHLEIAEPRVHWVEGYISPTAQSWIFSFHERLDGEIQLGHYREHGDPIEAVESYFDIATWYALVPTNLTWEDVVCTVSPDVPWTESNDIDAAAAVSPAVQESLKKSTIIWLRWKDGNEERTMPVWFVMDQGKIYVLSGERQQTIPGVERLRQVDVILRWKGKNAQVAEIPADVRIVPQGPEWDTLAEKIAEKRLNIPGLPEETARRWRDECEILELTLRT
ncbi:MAG: hypothetical protein QOH26_1590 [Actinomycetota bacterium]|nr:hypothetical protein [Actinomycetota bacterium]